MNERKNSSAFMNTPTRRQLIAGMAVAFGCLTLRSSEAWARAEEEISHGGSHSPRAYFQSEPEARV